MEWIAELNYLTWFSIGLVFVLLEMFTPGMYLIWFGAAAFAMGILVSFVTLTPTETGVIYALLSALFAGVGWWVYDRVLNKTKVPEKYKYLNDMAGAHIGKVYNLSQDVIDGRSKAKIGDSFWIIETDAQLKQGAKVKIKDVKDGVILIAEEYKEKH